MILISRRAIMMTASTRARNSFAPKALPAVLRNHRIISRFSPLGVIAIATLLSTASAFAQVQRGTLVHEETIRVSPSADTAKLGEAGRGHELIIIESSREWTHVEAILREPRRDADEDDPESQGKTITGWVLTKALVGTSTPDGDKIIFGEAANSE